MRWMLSLGVVAVAAGFSGFIAPANANQVLINWYSVSPTFPDFNLAPCGVQNCGQDFTNEVGATLSGGLPVVAAGNPAAPTANRASWKHRAAPTHRRGDASMADLLTELT